MLCLSSSTVCVRAAVLDCNMTVHMYQRPRLHSCLDTFLLTWLGACAHTCLHTRGCNMFASTSQHRPSSRRSSAFRLVLPQRGMCPPARLAVQHYVGQQSLSPPARLSTPPPDRSPAHTRVCVHAYVPLRFANMPACKPTGRHGPPGRMHAGTCPWQQAPVRMSVTHGSAG